MSGWMDGWIEGWMDGRMDGWMDGWIHKWEFKGLNSQSAVLVMLLPCKRNLVMIRPDEVACDQELK